jgi:8-oxo-dGTP diphosphatase
MINTATMIEVTCAIIMKGDHVLIAQRSETMSHPLRWEFPGGKLKPGESPLRCVVREIREELNAEIDVEQLLPSVVHSYDDTEIKLIPFICTLESGEISLQQHRDYRWIRKSEVEAYDILDADLEVIAKMNGQWQ